MKIHKYLFAFAGTLLFLTFGHAVVLYKYFQILIHHGLYYCQEMAKSLNLEIPGAYGKLLASILLLAGAFTLLKLFGSIYKIFIFRKTLLKKKIERNADLECFFASLGLHGKVLIFIQSKPQAFCFGIRNPKIYISTGLIQLMDRKELEIILRHEKYHLEHKDTLTLLLATIIESLFPFFPVLSDFTKVYRTDREVAADKAAMTLESDRQSLKNVLKKLIQYEPGVHPVFLPAIMSTNTLEARIRSMHFVDAAYKNIGLRSMCVSLISLAALLSLMVTPVNAIELHADGRDVIMLCNGSATCETICRKETLQLLQSNQSLYTPTTAGNFSKVQ